jgi:hypothetical protein
MKALAQMRSEKNPTTTNAISEPIVQYNREGLLKSIEGRDLPFEESMQICEFAVEIQDENDDLEREVRQIDVRNFNFAFLTHLFCSWHSITRLFELLKWVNNVWKV